MPENIREYIRSHPCQGFKAAPHYSVDGDFVTYFFNDADCYAQQIDDTLTLYLSNDGDKLVGVKLSGMMSWLASSPIASGE